MRRLFARMPSSHIDTDGVSRLARKDGTTTIVPAEYWQSIRDLHPIELYHALAAATPLVIINATQDEVIGGRDFSGLAPNIQVVEIPCGHNFEGSARQELIDALSKCIV